MQIANINFLLAKQLPESLELSGSLAKTNKEIAVENLPAFFSKTFGNLFSSYTQALNKQQNRKGSLFIPNFKRKPIDKIEYYNKLIFYIHNNPIHHGFAKNMQDWTYSSYNSYLTEKKTKIAKKDVLNWFGNKEEFTRFHIGRN